MAKIITYHNDPNDPLFGQTTERGEDDTPSPVPRELTKTQFTERCYAVLGALSLPQGTQLEQYEKGMELFQEMIEALEAHSNAKLRRAAGHFKEATVFVKDKVDLFFEMLVTATLLDGTVKEAIIATWPNE